MLALDKLFLSTPSARRATTSFHFCVTLVLISIHALREEGDCPLNGPASPASRFLSTPSARRATVNSFNVYIDGVFLSTPSARRATVNSFNVYIDGVFLSTPSARRATRGAAGRGASSPDFYPRPPRGGRLVLLAVRIQIVQISIHALREEGDNCSSLAAAMTGRISIHALREEGDQNLT